MQIGAASSMQPGRKSGAEQDEDRSAAEPAGDGPRRGPAGQGHRSRRDVVAGGRNWLTEPRKAVFLVLGGVILVGGGWKLLQAWRARKGVARLEEADVSTAEIEAAVRFGRDGLPELFRIFSESPSSPHRDAAGRAIAALWAQDQLIGEEEQALVRRGYAAHWTARRRYPRSIRTEMPIIVTYGLPFLQEGDGLGIKPDNLEWSHRVTGSRRASLEEYSPWVPGAGRMEFTLVPGDFETNGPHRLVLQTRVRTRGLTDSWQIELPHLPFSFEFDPRLEVSSLLALADEPRGEVINHALRLVAPDSTPDDRAVFLPLNAEMAIRNPPRVVVATPLPCDLSHRAFLEIDQVAGRFPAGAIILSGQGNGRAEVAGGSRTQSFPVGPIAPIPHEAIDRPGRWRLRIVLEADPDRGWTDPEIRSIWPGTIETGWVDAEIVRR